MQNLESKQTARLKSNKVVSIPDPARSDYPKGVADFGYDIYHKNCKACHGDYAQGGFGPKLEQNSILQNNQQFWMTLFHGRGNMPAWEGRLSTQQIADVHAYLKTLSPTEP